LDKAQASADLRAVWFDFLDAAVVKCQTQKSVDTPPVFVVLFVDLHLNVGQDEDFFRHFKTYDHPRLLCLFNRT
jgi:hypothetical protein